MAALYTQTLMTPIWHQQTPKLPAKQNIQHNKQPKKYIALNFPEPFNPKWGNLEFNLLTLSCFVMSNCEGYAYADHCYLKNNYVYDGPLRYSKFV